MKQCFFCDGRGAVSYAIDDIEYVFDCLCSGGDELRVRDVLGDDVVDKGKKLMRPFGEPSMTLQEWLVCQNTAEMISLFGGGTRESQPEFNGGVIERKHRLFACACCRQAWDVLSSQCHKVIELAEKCADGSLPIEILKMECRKLRGAVGRAYCCWYLGEASTGWQAAMAAKDILRPFETDLGLLPIGPDLLRDIYGPLPFGHFSINPSWLAWNGGVVPKIAQSIYDERLFSDLPILADALEEAGCDDADILSHCRQPGPHVLGCWVLDLLLGKGWFLWASP